MFEELVLGNLNTYLRQTSQGLYANMKQALSESGLLQIAQQCASGSLAISKLQVSIKVHFTTLNLLPSGVSVS